MCKCNQGALVSVTTATECRGTRIDWPAENGIVFLRIAIAFGFCQLL